MEQIPVFNTIINYHYIYNYDDDLIFCEMIRRYIQDAINSDNNILTNLIMEIVYDNFLKIDTNRWRPIINQLDNDFIDFFFQHICLNNTLRFLL